MASRNGRSVWQAWAVLGLWCLVALAAPAAVRGDGSITFDGADSKLINTGADLLNSEDEFTICAWVYRAGAGEGGSGVVFTMDEIGGTGSSVKIINSGSTLVFASAFASPGVWTIPFEDNAWSAVAVTYDKSNKDVDPTFRVNFNEVAEAEPAAPDGAAPTIPAGYCVGNLSSGGNTWDGRISHVQVFNRILSADEMDACLRAPGSVKNGLRLWLPMTNDSEIVDRSGNGFDGTSTALVTSVEGPAITLEPGAVPGITVLSAGYTAVTQLVVPRYANGVSHPAGQLLGQGPASVVQGLSYGLSDGSNPQLIIKTEDYGETMNQWDNGEYDEMEGVEAVLQPVVRNLTIIGHDDAANDYQDTGGTAVKSEPQENPLFPFGDAIDFNGTTSKLEHITANVLDSAKQVSVCCWINPDGWGENDEGHVIVLDEESDDAATAAFAIYHDAADDTLLISKYKGAVGTTGVWSIPITDEVWNGVCVRLDFTTDAAPTARVNYKKVPVTEVTPPSGATEQPDSGYCVGNRNAGDRTWDGRIAQVQVFNDILTDQESDDALADPGSVTSNLRLYLPMTDASDSGDDSGNGFTGTPTALSDGQNYHDRETGLAIQASGPRVEDVSFYHIAGTSLVLSRGDGVRAGAILPFDREYATLRDLTVYRAYRGFLINTIDTEVGNIEGQYLRDWGVKVPALTGGVKFQGAVHVSGVVSGVAPAAYGTSVWFEEGAGPCWGSGPWYCDTSDVGMRIDSSGNKITNFYSKVCTYRNLWFDWNAQRNSVENFEIEVKDNITETFGGEAVLIRGQANSLVNGTIGGGDEGPIPGGETAIRLRNGTRQVIRDVTFVGTAGSSAPLITIDGDDVTLEDSTIVAKCFAAGTFVELFPVVTSGTARGGDADEIQLATSTGIPDDDLIGMAVFITSGTGSGQSSTITDYIASTHTATVSPEWSTHPDDDSVYEVRANRLGTGNHIALTTAGTVTKPLNLDSRGWDDWQNTIVVNGVEQVSPAVELTINSGGAITASQRNHVVDTFADASSDDLDTINGGIFGRIVVIRAADSARTVVVKDGTGNLQLSGDFSLDNTDDTITLHYDGSNWVERSRSNNGI